MTITVIEIDIPFCDLTYGNAPCTAVASPGNLAPNPSFETDSNANSIPDSWEDTSIGTGLTRSILRVASPVVQGSWAHRLNITAITPPTQVNVHAIVSSVASAIPVEAGRLYTASVFGRTSTLTYLSRIQIDWRDSGGGTISSSSADHTFSGTSAFERFSVAAIAPSGAVTARLRVAIVRPSVNDTTLGNIVWDCFQFEQGSLTDWSAAGFTGARKCFNTIRTCQDRANFTPSTLTLRFCMPAGDTEFTRFGQPVVVIPSVKSVSVTPAVVNPGVDIGARETVRVVFEDHPHSDAGLDKYLADRDYDPFQRGTFFAKLRARNPSLEGYALRMLIGDEGDALEDMTTYNYVIDSAAGQGEQFTVAAKDVLILADKKKAQAPRISNGVLAAGISAVAGSLTLSPSGIGNAEYPASGKVAIAGKEICQFTRVGDVLTLTQRGDSGTEADEHDEGDIVQLVLIYESEEPSIIINDLLVNYTPGVDAAWINTAEWATEVDEYIGRLYSAEIADPTSVVDLLNELIEQVGLVFWWDSIAMQLRLRSLRPVSAEATLYTDDHIMATTFRPAEQPGKRISEVWTYYGIRNPLESIDEAKNYRAAIATIDPNADLDYEQPAIKKIFSRWIAANNRPAASRLNSMLLSRYRDAPRKFSFSLYETIDQVPALGAGFRVQSWSLQDDTGDTVAEPAQITSLERREDRFVIDAQEALFSSQDDLETARVIFIDENTDGVNLRTIHDQIYSEPQSYDIVRCIVSSGAIAGTLVVGDWPEFVDLTLLINGMVLGRGGNGESISTAAGAGTTAIYTRYPIAVDNQGTIGGGGGGGGFSPGTVEDPVIGGGGGGAGYPGGIGGGGGASNGSSAGGGAGGGGGAVFGGAGGNLGQAGQSTGFSTGGAAGIAVDGESYITYVNEGAISGARVN